MLTEEAQEALDRTKTQLAPQLEDARELVASLQDRNQESDDTDKRINAALERIPVQSLEPVARSAMIESENADLAAQRALGSIKNMVDQLPEYIVEAKQIPKDVDDTTKKISGATTQGITCHDIIVNYISDLSRVRFTSI